MHTYLILILNYLKIIEIIEIAQLGRVYFEKDEAIGPQIAGPPNVEDLLIFSSLVVECFWGAARRHFAPELH